MDESCDAMNDQTDNSLSLELDSASSLGRSKVQPELSSLGPCSSEGCTCSDVTSTGTEASNESLQSVSETTNHSTEGEEQFDNELCMRAHFEEASQYSECPGNHADVHTCLGEEHHSSCEDQLAGQSSRSTVVSASNAGELEASGTSGQCSHGGQQYCQASICSCFCTCEHYEEMNDMYETEESMPVCVQCEELSPDVMCTCDDNIVIVKPLYAIHCCTCGVQLAHGRDPTNNVDEDGSDEASAVDPPVPDDLVESIPAPPPPPSQSYLFLGSRLTRTPASRRGANGGPEAPDGTAATPTLLLRALSCDDGSEFDTRLHEAARAGLADRLEALLKEDNLRANVNSRVRPLMATPLREAVVGGNDECVRLLLAAGAEVDAIDIKGQTALFMAASLGRAAIVETLLKAGADPEGSRNNNCTPLLLTIREGCVDSLKSLLRRGVDPEPLSILRTCTPGWPLQYCVVFRRLDCFLELLKGGAEPSLAVVLSRADQSTADVDEPILRRLSIVRSVLQHASHMPEFIRVYREFGGPIEQISALPDSLQVSTSSARQELQASLDNPLRLTSLCRICLRRVVGAAQLPVLAEEFGLPAHLQAYLAFADLDRWVALSNDDISFRQP